jgi:hypothetical protein
VGSWLIGSGENITWTNQMVELGRGVVRSYHKNQSHLRSGLN